jgi:DNA/RNA endonuclease YhcR with UshA esterase domain
MAAFYLGGMKIFFTLMLLLVLKLACSQDSLSVLQQDTLPHAILTAFGAGKIKATEAKAFIGKEMCVCGKVVSTKYKDNGGISPTYINLDKKYPDQVFTLMIYGSDRKNFYYKPEEFLLGKIICVKGKIAAYKGTPQIVATKEKQVEILQAK